MFERYGDGSVETSSASQREAFLPLRFINCLRFGSSPEDCFSSHQNPMSILRIWEYRAQAVKATGCSDEGQVWYRPTDDRNISSDDRLSLLWDR